MVLSTERLILREWRDEDLAAFAWLNDDPAVMEFMPRRLNRDESDAFAARIRTDMERRGWGLWAVEVRGPASGAVVTEVAAAPVSPEAGAPTAITAAPFIGYVGLSVPSFDAHFTPCVEIGWRLAKEHWGHGYASEAAAACLRFAFETLNLKQIVAFTVPLNRRSMRVMERIGMTRDRAGDFEHPRLAPGHPLRSHVLYRINRM
jgi:RimJ/RimL family protein N-acetyltransferase